MSSDRFQRLGSQIRTEIQDTARERAGRLFGEVPAGTTDVGQKEAVAMAQRNWPDPKYREGLLRRVRETNFRDTTIKVFGNNPEIWPSEVKED